MAVRVTCINKDGGDHYDPHEAITDLGWLNEETKNSSRSTLAEMVKFLEVDKGTAYVKDAYGNKVYLVVRISSKGNKYVKTVADGRETNNLLALMECVA